MKLTKHLCTAVLLAAPLLIATTRPATAFEITLEPSTTTIHAGDTFEVLVTATDLFAGRAGDELLAYGFNVALSPGTAATLTGATVASGFNDDRTLIGLDVAASAFPGLTDPGSSMNLLLSRLTLAALSPGAVLLTLTADLSDPSQGLVFFADGSVGFSQTLSLDIHPAPAPATAALLAAGLFGLARRRPARVPPHRAL